VGLSICFANFASGWRWEIRPLGEGRGHWWFGPHPYPPRECRERGEKGQARGPRASQATRLKEEGVGDGYYF
jgi:hypothetical protein